MKTNIYMGGTVMKNFFLSKHLFPLTLASYLRVKGFDCTLKNTISDFNISPQYLHNMLKQHEKTLLAAGIKLAPIVKNGKEKEFKIDREKLENFLLIECEKKLLSLPNMVRLGQSIVRGEWK